MFIITYESSNADVRKDNRRNRMTPCLEAAMLPMTRESFTVCQLPEPSGNWAQILAKGTRKSTLPRCNHHRHHALHFHLHASPLKTQTLGRQEARESR